MRFLDLRSNNISQITKYVFYGLRSLETITLEDNPVVHVKVHAFIHLTSLKTIDSGNFLPPTSESENSVNLPSGVDSHNNFLSVLHPVHYHWQRPQNQAWPFDSVSQPCPSKTAGGCSSNLSSASRPRQSASCVGLTLPQSTSPPCRSLTSSQSSMPSLRTWLTWTGLCSWGIWSWKNWTFTCSQGHVPQPDQAGEPEP